MYKQLMPKAIIVITIGILFVTGCKDQDEQRSGNVSVTVEDKRIARDVSIDKNNAYNDLFLDSAIIEKFIATEKLDSSLAFAMRNFYNARNYQYAWFASTGLIEQSFSFHSLFCTENDCDQFNKSLENRLDRLRIEDDSTIVATDPSTIKTELQITQRFIQYAKENGKTTGTDYTNLGTYIPAKKNTVMGLAEAVLADNNKNGSPNEPFMLLKGSLQKYTTIAKNGGWPAITSDAKKYSPGASAPALLSIKKRLQITGELTGNDTTALFTPELENAVKTYQLNHGYKPTGIITEDLVKDMNIPAITRVQQLLINMQRMRWMPSRPEGKLIIVNIPEFVLYVDSGKHTLFQMDVVVGAEGHKTTLFSGNLNQVVFSPYWNVPPSIVRKEILPAIERNSNYLAKKNMEITGQEGGLPVIRQRPGAKNALGKVKFLFPNSFNIYMHDTPEKSLFERDERGLSHGCIRLSDPVKMANFLLQDSEKWSPEKIAAAMNSGKEQFVKIKDPVPVIITYYTAWVDDKGVQHFADDIYGHDKEMAVKLFTDPQ
ncbi:MAG: hypothetical protein K0Q79_3610 [Flavipsychrobacter sp.]|jgi:murein L,D-transpeptidase YcbB/YkuD|nr:hypothetical protein [Flavipsychrobacter sp.]